MHAMRAETERVPRSVFETGIGWFGLWGTREGVAGVVIGHRTAAAARRAISVEPAEESDWWPELRRRLQRFTEGERVEFADVPLAVPSGTSFHRRVVRRVRAIGYGCVESYGDVARAAGSPRAARAVGRVMATNPVPILIPCHRVVAAAGSLGGFSAPGGLRLKRRLLELEADDPSS